MDIAYYIMLVVKIILILFILLNYTDGYSYSSENIFYYISYFPLFVLILLVLLGYDIYTHLRNKNKIVKRINIISMFIIAIVTLYIVGMYIINGWSIYGKYTLLEVNSEKKMI
jgi:hypothetical protein